MFHRVELGRVPVFYTLDLFTFLSYCVMAFSKSKITGEPVCENIRMYMNALTCPEINRSRVETAVYCVVTASPVSGSYAMSMKIHQLYHVPTMAHGPYGPRTIFIRNLFVTSFLLVNKATMLYISSASHLPAVSFLPFLIVLEKEIT